MSKPGNLGRGLGDLFDEASSARTTLPSFEQGFAQLPAATIRLPDWMSGRLKNNTALDDLASSVQAHGILQPILVRKVDTGYEIVSGARRYAAAIHNGQQDIPAIILTAGDDEMLDIYLQENFNYLRPAIDRDSPEAAALCAHFNISQEELRARINAIIPRQTDETEATEPVAEEVALADAVEPLSLEFPSKAEPRPRIERPSEKREESSYKLAFFLSTAALICAVILAVVAFFGRRIERVIVEVPAPVPTVVAETTPETESAAVASGATQESSPTAQETAQLAQPVETAPVAAPFMLPQELIDALKQNGLTIRPGKIRTEIVFNEPVFSYRSEINAESEALLNHIAKALQPWISQTHVRVYGHTDNDPITSSAYHSNFDLGLQRAATVAEYLQRLGGIPSDRLFAASNGELKAPYANDTPATKAKNRTITILITP